jgi:hypothetical protein
LIRVDADSGDPTSGVARRLEAARLEFDAQAQRFEKARSRLEETADIFRTVRPRRSMLYYSAYARLQAAHFGSQEPQGGAEPQPLADSAHL